MRRKILPCHHHRDDRDAQIFFFLVKRRGRGCGVSAVVGGVASLLLFLRKVAIQKQRWIYVILIICVLLSKILPGMWQTQVLLNHSAPWCSWAAHCLCIIFCLVWSEEQDKGELWHGNMDYLKKEKELWSILSNPYSDWIFWKNQFSLYLVGLWVVGAFFQTCYVSAMWTLKFCLMVMRVGIFSLLHWSILRLLKGSVFSYLGRKVSQWT